MTDSNAELREYFDKLVHHFLNTKSMRQQLKSVLAWTSPALIDALNRGQYFFQLAAYSLSRIVLIELSTLLSHKEKRSLFHWLKRALECAAEVKPTRYNPHQTRGEREPISVKEFRALIDGQIAELDARKDTIARIKGRRDKAIVHLDKEYFDDPQALSRDYPLTDNDLDDLIELVGSILRKHHSCLFGSDIIMEVKSAHTIDAVLEYTRAFMRARQDFDLIKMGFRPALYLREDYEQRSAKPET